MVSLDWLLESIQAKRPLSEKKYTLTSSKPSDGQDDQKDGNKEVAARGNKRTIEAEDSETDGQVKKQKDDQKAICRPLTVPVDEAFLAEHRTMFNMDFSSKSVLC